MAERAPKGFELLQIRVFPRLRPRRGVHEAGARDAQVGAALVGHAVPGRHEELLRLPHRHVVLAEVDAARQRDPHLALNWPLRAFER